MSVNVQPVVKAKALLEWLGRGFREAGLFKSISKCVRLELGYSALQVDSLPSEPPGKPYYISLAKMKRSVMLLIQPVFISVMLFHHNAC